jgi:hypothetical protein
MLPDSDYLVTSGEGPFSSSSAALPLRSMGNVAFMLHNFSVELNL